MKIKYELSRNSMLLVKNGSMYWKGPVSLHEKGDRDSRMWDKEGSVQNMKKKFTKKYKTNLGEASFDLIISANAQYYSAGAPGTERKKYKTDSYYKWDARKMFFEVKKIVLPTGYTMEVSLFMPSVANMGDININKPHMAFWVTTKVAPMVASWTKYQHMGIFQPDKKKLTLR